MHRVFPSLRHFHRRFGHSIRDVKDFEEKSDQLGIKYFLVNFLDLLGHSRAKIVPRQNIREVSKTGAGFQGYATFMGMPSHAPDLLAIPDLNSLIQCPWKPELGWLSSELVVDEEIIPTCPRNNLKKQIAALEQQHNATFEVGVECEFYILKHTNGDYSRPLSAADPLDRKLKSCYGQTELMRNYEFMTKLLGYMNHLGWEAYQCDHEDGNGQFELNWKFADALTTADRHSFFKFMVKTLAEEYGVQATFMPKPFVNMPGNGLHAHVNLSSKTTKENLFLDRSDKLGLSKMGYHFLGGILSHVPTITAIGNPIFNSYRRIAPTSAMTSLSGASWTPHVVSYSGNNRTHLVRVPAPGRFEFRLADGATHPYLLPSALLVAGLDGLTKNIHPGPPNLDNAHEYTIDDIKRLELTVLPKSLEESLKNLKNNKVFRLYLGDEFVDKYSELKKAEFESLWKTISSAETEQSFDC